MTQVVYKMMRDGSTFVDEIFENSSSILRFGYQLG